MCDDQTWIAGLRKALPEEMTCQGKSNQVKEKTNQGRGSSNVNALKQVRIVHLN